MRSLPKLCRRSANLDCASSARASDHVSEADPANGAASMRSSFLTPRWRRESAANSSLETLIYFRKEERRCRKTREMRDMRPVFGLDLAHIVPAYPAANQRLRNFCTLYARVRARDHQDSGRSNPVGADSRGVHFRTGKRPRVSIKEVRQFLAKDQKHVRRIHMPRK